MVIRRSIRGALLSAILLSATPAAAQDAGARMFSLVQGIEGKTPEGRRDFIKDRLRTMGIGFQVMPFDTTITRGQRSFPVSGENIVVTLGSGRRSVVVGAHLDAVPGSPGANDNGGGVAVVLQLIESLRSHPWNHTMVFCFFDREEDGLVGSAVFVRTAIDRARHLAMVNLDVQGTGDVVYVGPVGGGDDDLLMPFVRRAATETGLPLSAREVYPSSDHLSFARAGLENISISIVPRDDVDKLVQLLSGGGNTLEVPEVLRRMHTPSDSSSYVRPEALDMSYRFTKSLLTFLNAAK